MEVKENFHHTLENVNEYNELCKYELQLMQIYIDTYNLMNN